MTTQGAKCFESSELFPSSELGFSLWLPVQACDITHPPAPHRKCYSVFPVPPPRRPVSLLAMKPWSLSQAIAPVLAPIRLSPCHQSEPF